MKWSPNDYILLVYSFIFYVFYCLDVAKERSYEARSNKSRSSFSVEQVLQLERVFERQKYLGSRDRQRIAEQLQMTETQVTHLPHCLSLHRSVPGKEGGRTGRKGLDRRVCYIGNCIQEQLCNRNKVKALPRSNLQSCNVVLTFESVDEILRFKM